MSRILIIDDEPDVLETLSRGLSRRGYSVNTAKTGEDGIKMAKAEKYDTALIDIRLPGIDGVCTLEQIKKADPDTEAIMITGFGTIESAKECMKKGAYDYIEKPIDIERICIFIEKALEKHRLTAAVALYEISKAIFSTIEMDELLKIIVGQAMTVLGADDSSIMLFDESGRLYIAFSHGLDEEIKRSSRLAIGERIAGWVAQEKQGVILINGLKADARFADIKGREDIKSSIVVPLVKNDSVLGILTANRKQIEENFSKIDLYKSNIFASLVALALDNANLYKKLRVSQLQLSRSAKLAALGRLASDMAHEVNNPLMIISGSAQLCLMENAPEEEKRKNLNIVVNQCQRAKDIILRLLGFSRPSKGLMKDVDINSSIDSVANMLEHQFSLSGVEIKRNYSPNLPQVCCDEQQMQEVFMNLLNNARDAISGQGCIEIRTACENDFVEIVFKDSGCGMTEDILKNIFEPFFTTKEKGNGLGLSICYNAVKSHSGELKFDSEPGKGTQAVILMPVKKRADA